MLNIYRRVYEIQYKSTCSCTRRLTHRSIKKKSLRRFSTGVCRKFKLASRSFIWTHLPRAVIWDLLGRLMQTCLLFLWTRSGRGSHGAHNKSFLLNSCGAESTGTLCQDVLNSSLQTVFVLLLFSLALLFPAFPVLRNTRHRRHRWAFQALDCPPKPV